ncbi:hypothetical protein RRG08_015939 [Elysia crispata]|uniref:Uncharacterized protein n=1 Tax=Elysia crispata TaxID=231223 RepID=A0AAE1E1U1_9GAST|nr:hypothetical protein RRG08_015939 [Elysia crispata]
MYQACSGGLRDDSETESWTTLNFPKQADPDLNPFPGETKIDSESTLQQDWDWSSNKLRRRSSLRTRGSHNLLVFPELGAPLPSTLCRGSTFFLSLSPMVKGGGIKEHSGKKRETGILTEESPTDLCDMPGPTAPGVLKAAGFIIKMLCYPATC